MQQGRSSFQRNVLGQRYDLHHVSDSPTMGKKGNYRILRNKRPPPNKRPPFFVIGNYKELKAESWVFEEIHAKKQEKVGLFQF